MKLAGMTASVATNYARGQVKGVFQDAETRAREKARSDARSGELIAQTLGELKGAAMKVGQLASVARDILPDDLMSSLSSLQRDAPPMDYDVIAAQIERELGSPPELLFQRFDRTPFAAASIGQVHRACTDDGREVVVKVQYPGVDESVDSDIMHLKLALRASGLLSMRRAASLRRSLRATGRIHTPGTLPAVAFKSLLAPSLIGASMPGCRQSPRRSSSSLQQPQQQATQLK